MFTYTVQELEFTRTMTCFLKNVLNDKKGLEVCGLFALNIYYGLVLVCGSYLNIIWRNTNKNI
jgi:hypothetical protein